jgi:hypothetical protein
MNRGVTPLILKFGTRYEWTASRSSRFTPFKCTLYRVRWRFGWSRSLSWCLVKISLNYFESRSP